jgi:hypothetical protein
METWSSRDRGEHEICKAQVPELAAAAGAAAAACHCCMLTPAELLQVNSEAGPEWGPRVDHLHSFWASRLFTRDAGASLLASKRAALLVAPTPLSFLLLPQCCRSGDCKPLFLHPPIPRRHHPCHVCSQPTTRRLGQGLWHHAATTAEGLEGKGGGGVTTRGSSTSFQPPALDVLSACSACFPSHVHRS